MDLGFLADGDNPDGKIAKSSRKKGGPRVSPQGQAGVHGHLSLGWKGTSGCCPSTTDPWVQGELAVMATVG